MDGETLLVLDFVHAPSPGAEVLWTLGPDLCPHRMDEMATSAIRRPVAIAWAFQWPQHRVYDTKNCADRRILLRLVGHQQEPPCCR